MSINRGEYLKNLIHESEYSISEISKKTGVGRNTVYRWMSNEKLPLNKLLRVAEAIGADISTEFPEILRLEEEKRKKLILEDGQNESITMKTKYLLLLEKHTYLLEELSQLKEEISKYKKGS